MDNYQRPVFELRSAPPAKQRRITVFFRYFMVIPHFFVLWLFGIAAYVLTVIGWFAILFTGRNPFHEFVSNYIRWATRVIAYLYFLTDVYPPFSLEGDAGYPIETRLDQGPMSRVTVFFRILLSIPAAVISMCLNFGMIVFGAVAWLITLITGTLPTPLHLGFTATVRFQARFASYSYLVQDPYPKGLFGYRAVAATPTLTSPHETDVAPLANTDSVAEDTASSVSELTPLTSGFAFRPMTPVVESAPTSSEWRLVLTNSARRVVIGELVVGVLGLIGYLVVYITLVSSLVTFTQDISWNQNNRSTIVTLNRAMIELEPAFATTTPDWTVITTDCSTMSSALEPLKTVPDYPKTGPNQHLLIGVGLIADVEKLCTTSVAPDKLTHELPVLKKLLDDGTAQLTVFLRQS
jgi:hypothetical protein